MSCCGLYSRKDAENCLINVVVVAVNYSSGSCHKRNAQFYELTFIIPSQNGTIAGFVIEALIKVVIVLQTGGILTVYQLNATRLNTTWDLTPLGSLLDWFGIQAIRVLYEA